MTTSGLVLGNKSEQQILCTSRYFRGNRSGQRILSYMQRLNR